MLTRPRHWSPMHWGWRSSSESHPKDRRSSTAIRVRSLPWTFTQRAIDSGLVPSMGSVGDCYDNAMIESFWSRMQVELLDRKRWKTRVELANAIFEYLEIFHNRKRRRSSLACSPRSSMNCRTHHRRQHESRNLPPKNPGHTSL